MTELGWITDYRWKILQSIHDSEGKTMTEISNDTEIDPGTVSRNLDKLAEKEVIDRNYRKKYSFTPEGKKVFFHLQKAAENMPDGESA